MEYRRLPCSTASSRRRVFGRWVERKAKVPRQGDSDRSHTSKVFSTSILSYLHLSSLSIPDGSCRTSPRYRVYDGSDQSLSHSSLMLQARPPVVPFSAPSTFMPKHCPPGMLSCISTSLPLHSGSAHNRILQAPRLLEFLLRNVISMGIFFCK